MRDTWGSREVPVLDFIVRELDERVISAGVTLGEVADGLVMDDAEVARAALALDGTYIGLHPLLTGGNTRPWRVTSVTPFARQATGQWPSGEALVERLIAGLHAAEERETDPERKGRLRTAAEAMAGIARGVVTEVAAAALRGSLGLP